jgi:hypothetical protein
MAAAGCASAPPATGFADVPMGSVFTYHRKSSGSLGSYDGQVVSTYAPATWAGQAVIAYGAPQAGTSLHLPADMARAADLNPAGKPVSFLRPADRIPVAAERGQAMDLDAQCDAAQQRLDGADDHQLEGRVLGRRDRACGDVQGLQAGLDEQPGRGRDTLGQSAGRA